MANYIDLGVPLVKAVGDKGVIGVRLTEWLGPDGISTMDATIADGVASVTVGTPAANTAVEVINGKSTEIGDAVMVPYEVVNGDVTIARILLDVQSTNANKKLNDRAIPIRIVG